MTDSDMQSLPYLTEARFQMASEVLELTDDLRLVCQAVYKLEGQTGVFAFLSWMGIERPLAHCAACEVESPMDDEGRCLVCGS